MALQLSTGLRNQLLDTNPFRTIFNLGQINLYAAAGSPPVNADAAIGGTNTLLLIYENTSGPTGLTFASSAAGGVITKNSSETWGGTSVAAGTAAFYRLVGSADTGVLSTTEPRVQGLVNTAGAEMNLPSTTIANLTAYVLDDFSIAIPTL